MPPVSYLVTHRLLRVSAAIVVFVFAACRESSEQAGAPVRDDDEAPDAGPGASTPYLASAEDGALWMSWMEPGPDSVWQLRVAHRPAGGAWSAPRLVLRDSLLFANWADFPSVVIDVRGHLVVHFLRRAAPGKYSYHAWVTASADSGATWSAPRRIHSDTSATEHGFAALVPLTDGGTLAAWLDGRATGGEQGAMSLGVGVLDADRRVQPDTMLDARTCDCCQVAGARTSHGVLFAYRDRSRDEVRDIAVVRFDEGRWNSPVIVHEDGWVTRACPVNGPALSAHGQDVALAWFTNARDTARVRLAFSTDGGATWGAPVRADDGNPIGRVDVEHIPGSGALVTWMERTGPGTADIRARRVFADGAMSGSVVVARTTDARPAGFPRTAAVGNRVYVAWREMTVPARLRLALLTIPAL